MNRQSRKKLFWVTVFGVAMGWFEAAVVVYLRLLYYPEGFEFPVRVIPMNVGWIELGREAATIIMLIALGILAGRTALERFGYFIYAFGVWDIVYYIGLKIAIGWPSGIFTWDLLFLIPLPWIGPILAPVLVSLAMMGACALIVIAEDMGKPVRTTILLWVLEIICGLIIIFSFIIDFRIAFTSGVPERFRWEIFLSGFIPGIIVFLYNWKRR